MHSPRCLGVVNLLRRTLTSLVAVTAESVRACNGQKNQNGQETYQNERHAAPFHGTHAATAMRPACIVCTSVKPLSSAKDDLRKRLNFRPS